MHQYGNRRNSRQSPVVCSATSRLSAGPSSTYRRGPSPALGPSSADLVTTGSRSASAEHSYVHRQSSSTSPLVPPIARKYTPSSSAHYAPSASSGRDSLTGHVTSSRYTPDPSSHTLNIGLAPKLDSNTRPSRYDSHFSRFSSDGNNFLSNSGESASSAANRYLSTAAAVRHGSISSSGGGGGVLPQNISSHQQSHKNHSKFLGSTLSNKSSISNNETGGGVYSKKARGHTNEALENNNKSASPAFSTNRNFYYPSVSTTISPNVHLNHSTSATKNSSSTSRSRSRAAVSPAQQQFLSVPASSNTIISNNSNITDNNNTSYTSKYNSLSNYANFDSGNFSATKTTGDKTKSSTSSSSYAARLAEDYERVKNRFGNSTSSVGYSGRASSSKNFDHVSVGESKKMSDQSGGGGGAGTEGRTSRSASSPPPPPSGRKTSWAKHYTCLSSQWAENTGSKLSISKDQYSYKPTTSTKFDSNFQAKIAADLKPPKNYPHHFSTSVTGFRKEDSDVGYDDDLSSDEREKASGKTVPSTLHHRPRSRRRHASKKSTTLSPGSNQHQKTTSEVDSTTKFGHGHFSNKKSNEPNEDVKSTSDEDLASAGHGSIDARIKARRRRLQKSRALLQEQKEDSWSHRRHLQLEETKQKAHEILLNPPPPKQQQSAITDFEQRRQERRSSSMLKQSLDRVSAMVSSFSDAPKSFSDARKERAKQSPPPPLACFNVEKIHKTSLQPSWRTTSGGDSTDSSSIRGLRGSGPGPPPAAAGVAVVVGSKRTDFSYNEYVSTIAPKKEFSVDHDNDPTIALLETERELAEQALAMSKKSTISARRQSGPTYSNNDKKGKVFQNQLIANFDVTSTFPADANVNFPPLNLPGKNPMIESVEQPGTKKLIEMFERTTSVEKEKGATSSRKITPTNETSSYGQGQVQGQQQLNKPEVDGTAKIMLMWDHQSKDIVKIPIQPDKTDRLEVVEIHWTAYGNHKVKNGYVIHTIFKNQPQKERVVFHTSVSRDQTGPENDDTSILATSKKYPIAKPRKSLKQQNQHQPAHVPKVKILSITQKESIIDKDHVIINNDDHVTSNNVDHGTKKDDQDDKKRSFSPKIIGLITEEIKTPSPVSKKMTNQLLPNIQQKIENEKIDKPSINKKVVQQKIPAAKIISTVTKIEENFDKLSNSKNNQEKIIEPKMSVVLFDRQKSQPKTAKISNTPNKKAESKVQNQQTARPNRQLAGTTNNPTKSVKNLEITLNGPENKLQPNLDNKKQLQKSESGPQKSESGPKKSQPSSKTTTNKEKLVAHEDTQQPKKSRQGQTGAVRDTKSFTPKRESDLENLTKPAKSPGSKRKSAGAPASSQKLLLSDSAHIDPVSVSVSLSNIDKTKTPSNSQSSLVQLKNNDQNALSDNNEKLKHNFDGFTMSTCIMNKNSPTIFNGNLDNLTNNLTVSDFSKLDTVTTKMMPMTEQKPVSPFQNQNNCLLVERQSPETRIVVRVIESSPEPRKRPLKNKSNEKRLDGYASPSHKFATSVENVSATWPPKKQDQNQNQEPENELMRPPFGADIDLYDHEEHSSARNLITQLKKMEEQQQHQQNQQIYQKPEIVNTSVRPIHTLSHSPTPNVQKMARNFDRSESHEKSLPLPKTDPSVYELHRLPSVDREMLQLLTLGEELCASRSSLHTAYSRSRSPPPSLESTNQKTPEPIPEVTQKSLKEPPQELGVLTDSLSRINSLPKPWHPYYDREGSTDSLTSFATANSQTIGSKESVGSQQDIHGPNGHGHNGHVTHGHGQKPESLYRKALRRLNEKENSTEPLFVKAGSHSGFNTGSHGSGHGGSGSLDHASHKVDEMLRIARAKHKEERVKFKKASDELDRVCEYMAQEFPPIAAKYYYGSIDRKAEKEHRAKITPAPNYEKVKSYSFNSRDAMEKTSGHVTNSFFDNTNQPSYDESKMDYTKRWLEGDLKSLTCDPKPDLLQFGSQCRIEADQKSIGSASAEVAAITNKDRLHALRVPDIVPKKCDLLKPAPVHIQHQHQPQNFPSSPSNFSYSNYQSGHSNYQNGQQYDQKAQIYKFYKNELMTNGQLPDSKSRRLLAEHVKACNNNNGVQSNFVLPKKEFGLVRKHVDLFDKMSDNESERSFLSDNIAYKNLLPLNSGRVSLTDNMAGFVKKFESEEVLPHGNGTGGIPDEKARLETCTRGVKKVYRLQAQTIRRAPGSTQSLPILVSGSQPRPFSYKKPEPLLETADPQDKDLLPQFASWHTTSGTGTMGSTKTGPMDSTIDKPLWSSRSTLNDPDCGSIQTSSLMKPVPNNLVKSKNSFQNIDNIVAELTLNTDQRGGSSANQNKFPISDGKKLAIPPAQPLKQFPMDFQLLDESQSQIGPQRKPQVLNVIPEYAEHYENIQYAQKRLEEAHRDLKNISNSFSYDSNPVKPSHSAHELLQRHNQYMKHLEDQESSKYGLSQVGNVPSQFSTVPSHPVVPPALPPRTFSSNFVLKPVGHAQLAKNRHAQRTSWHEPSMYERHVINNQELIQQSVPDTIPHVTTSKKDPILLENQKILSNNDSPNDDDYDQIPMAKPNPIGQFKKSRDSHVNESSNGTGGPVVTKNPIKNLLHIFNRASKNDKNDSSGPLKIFAASTPASTQAQPQPPLRNHLHKSHSSNANCSTRIDTSKINDMQIFKDGDNKDIEKHRKFKLGHWFKR